MLDIRKLKELVRLMVAADLTELDLRDSEEQVTLRRHQFNQAPPAGPPIGVHAPPAPARLAVAGGTGLDRETTEAEEAAEGLHQISSPMVGTFYAAPNPDAPPYISVGSRVEPNTVVCLIEAMKIFNEIKAECSGVVEKILVGNGDAVDFGQPMFLVRPA